MLYLRYLSIGILSRAVDGKPIIFAKVSPPGNYGVPLISEMELFFFFFFFYEMNEMEFFFFFFFFTKWSHTKYLLQTCMLLLVFFFFFFCLLLFFFFINYRRTINVNDIFYLIF